MAEKRQEKQHYWLMAGEVVWLDANQSEYRRGFNTVLITKIHRITAKDLGETQKAMQIRLMKEYNPEGLKITDVFLLNAVHMGHMTDAEFKEGLPKDVPQEVPGEILQ
jgi:hypothetical protein